MTLRRYLLLYGLGLLVLLGVAAFQGSPGYMDAEYYFAGGLSLAAGKGFQEQFLWNYLDDPAGLPHPSHAYWMPLASLVSALGLWATGETSFAAGRAAFVLLAAGLPPLTAALAFAITRRSDQAFLAGLLAALPAFYLPYLPTTDTFGLYMLGGGLFLLLAGPASASAPALRPLVQAGLLGLLAGLMHLARADGGLWLGVALAAVYLAWRVESRPQRLPALAAAAGMCAAGYLLVMGPWMARNWIAFGAPLAPGGGAALWVTGYDELYTYPADRLSAARWWAAGLPAALAARGEALALNLQSTLAVQGEIFLLPLVLAGGWRHRRDRRVRLGLLAWALTFAVMTFVFPFSGGRGGFFHSGAAVQPLLWALAPAGLEAVTRWAGRRRGWDIRQATKVFSAGVLALALMLSGLVLARRLAGDGELRQGWDAGAQRYHQVEAALQRLGAAGDEVVLVKNPPGYYVAAGRPGVAIPYGDLETVLTVARRYGASYLLLELEQVAGAEGLYEQPAGRPGLRYLETAAGVRIYQILDHP